MPLTSAVVSRGHLRLNKQTFFPSANSSHARRAFAVRAASSTYVAPSSVTGSSELEALERYSEVSISNQLPFRKETIDEAPYVYRLTVYNHVRKYPKPQSNSPTFLQHKKLPLVFFTLSPFFLLPPPGCS